MRVFYDDNSALNARAALYSFDGAGGYTLIAEAMGSGTPGFGSTLSSYFSHYVDNTNEALVVLADLPSSDDTLKFCGVRLRYQCSPPSCTYLPACFR